MADNNRKAELFEREPIPRAVAALSIPTVASSLVMLLYSMADTYFVGLLNAPVETAAVSLAAPVLLAFNAVNNLFGVGGSSMMSRALGRKDYKTLKQSSSLSFYGATVCGILFSLLCAVLMAPLLSLLGADATTSGATRRYLLWTVCWGATPSILNVVMAYLIRSEGATLHASIGTVSGCVLNIILDPLFILPGGFNMGAEGAAFATFLSNCFATLYFFGYLVVKRKSTYVCISPKELTLRPAIVKGVCAVGVPASIQNLLNVISHILLNAMASPYGAEALAAMGIAYRVSMIPMYINNGVTQGIMPLIGYTYAAKLHQRMKKALRFTAVICQTMLIALCVVCCVFSGPITRLFIQDPKTVEYGTWFLRGFAVSIPFLCLDFLAVGVFQAVGKGMQSLFMAIARKGLLEIPALFLLNFLLPLYGLSLAQLAAEVVMSVLGAVMLLRFLRQMGKEDTAIADAAE